MAEAAPGRRALARGGLPSRGRPARAVVRDARPDRPGGPVHRLAPRSSPASRTCPSRTSSGTTGSPAITTSGAGTSSTGISPSTTASTWASGPSSSFLFGLRRPWDRRRKVSRRGVRRLLPPGLRPLFALLLSLSGHALPLVHPLPGQVLPRLRVLPVHPGRAGLDDGDGRAGSRARKSTRTLAARVRLGLALFLAFKGRVLSVINALLIIEKDSSLRELGRSIATGLVLLAVYAVVFRSSLPGRGLEAGLRLGAHRPGRPRPGLPQPVDQSHRPGLVLRRPPLMAELKPPLTVYRADGLFPRPTGKERQQRPFSRLLSRHPLPPQRHGRRRPLRLQPRFLRDLSRSATASSSRKSRSFPPKASSRSCAGSAAAISSATTRCSRRRRRGRSWSKRSPCSSRPSPTGPPHPMSSSRRAERREPRTGSGSSSAADSIRIGKFSPRGISASRRDRSLRTPAERSDHASRAWR